MSDEKPKPIYVPVALPLAEARALFGAARATFAQLTVFEQAADHGGDLARGMYTLAEAIDRATGHGDVALLGAIDTDTGHDTTTKG